MYYFDLSKEQLEKEKQQLEKQYKEFKSKGLNLDISRGKPAEDQLDLSLPMLDLVNSEKGYKTTKGFDCRNYGVMDGIPECKKMYADMMQVPLDTVMIGGSSSLNMIFDTITCMMTASIHEDCKPWYEIKNRKFLCPVPGYDRHFGILEYYGFEMINISMTETGPDMDMVEKLVAEDDSIKGMICVPKYSNPCGTTYSDETVKRLAKLQPKAKDFKIIWDDAYCVHDLDEKPDKLLSIMDESKKVNNEDVAIVFCSTSKITFAGSGVGAMAASENNMKIIKKKYSFQTIGYDKLNMMRHLLFLKDYNNLLEHMKKHKEIIKPKFDVVLSKLETQVKNTGVANWTKPKGGYFISVDVYEGTAKKVVQMCKDAGLILTGAGATYPHGKDPKDSNIRVAPTYPPVEELTDAMDVFCTCIKLAGIEKILENK